MAFATARIKAADYDDEFDKIYSNISPDVPKEEMKKAFYNIIAESA